MKADFKYLMSARFLFTFAVQMQAVVLGWHMWDLTHDALFLGFIGLTEAIPAIGLALFAGYIVDRNRPLPVYRWVIFGSFVSGLIMLLTQSYLVLTTQQQIVGLFCSSFITGAARGFSQPAIFAIVPRIVSREELPRASAWMSTAMQTSRISGPALGGMIFGWMGIATSAWVVCGTLIAAQLALVLIKNSPGPALLKRTNKLKEELWSGAAFVFKHPILLPALTLDMVSVLFGGVTALLPIYASDVLHIGPKGLGALRAAPAVGATLMSFSLTNLDFREKAGRWLLSSVAGFGLCILVFALSQNFMLSFGALLFSGMFDSVSMVVRSTAVQIVSPDAMRGRISAVNSIFIGSSNELGEFESGVAARFLGAMPAATFGGVMCLATVALVAYLSPTLRRLNLKHLQDAQVPVTPVV